MALIQEINIGYERRGDEFFAIAVNGAARSERNVTAPYTALAAILDELSHEVRGDSVEVDDARLKKILEIEELICSGSAAVREVLMREKNLAKGPLSEDIRENYDLADIEMTELFGEIVKTAIDYEKTMYEAADAIAFLFKIIAICRSRLGR